MEAQWLLCLAPLLSLFINVITQILSVHCLGRIGLSIIVGLVTGLLSNGFFLVNLAQNGADLTLEDTGISLLSYLALSFCFWAFLNLNITSLRMRLFRELLKEDENGLSPETLQKRYSTEELIERRILRLEAGKHLHKVNDKWVLKSRKLLVFVWVSNMLRALIIPSHS